VPRGGHEAVAEHDQPERPADEGGDQREKGDIHRDTPGSKERIAPGGVREAGDLCFGDLQLDFDPTVEPDEQSNQRRYQAEKHRDSNGDGIR